MPRKPRIEDCPFQVGDVVRVKAAHAYHKIPPLSVTKTMVIPDLHKMSYGPDVRACPYWIHGENFSGQLHTARGDQDDPHAIWVGFLELDPFLGAARRAVMESDDYNNV